MSNLLLIEVKILLSQTAVNQQNHFSEQIFIIVRNRTIKATKCSLCSNTKMTQIHLQEQCVKCKRSFKTSRGLNQHTRVRKQKPAIDSKVIDTTSTNFFPITNVPVDEKIFGILITTY